MGKRVAGRSSERQEVLGCGSPKRMQAMGKPCASRGQAGPFCGQAMFWDMVKTLRLLHLGILKSPTKYPYIKRENYI